MKKAIVGLCFALLSSMAWALPTVQDVEAATRAGKYSEAETMMSEVVAAKPGSAKAHYIYAELLARNGNFAKASQEASRAREIDPKVTFTDPEKFRSFEATLQRERTPAPRPSSAVTERPASSMTPMRSAAPEAPRGGIPGWVWLVGLAVIAFVAFKMFGARRQQPAAFNGGGPGGPAAGYSNGPAGLGGGPGQGGMMPNQGYPQQGYGPGYGPQGRPGGGLLGTGMAVAGGVAGGMLLDQMLNRHADAATHAGGAAAGAGLGGLDPGSYDAGSASAANELENRQVDFGSGDNWDSGGGDSGGSFDSGGGDSGGGGWD